MTRGKSIVRMPARKLTRRELEVLTLTATGKTRDEISQCLSLSEETVKDYIESACRKLHAVSKTHAAVLAVVLGLIAPYELDQPKRARK
jgi:LuxR family quorum sensing-dependent transcriptional regulator